MIKFLIEKEFKQLLRNSFLPKMILIFPCMIMILMPWAANLEIKNINLNIVDNDHSVLSRRLVDKIGASTYFRTTALPDTYNEGLRSIEIGSADIILEIPRDFEKNWVTGNSPRLLVACVLNHKTEDEVLVHLLGGDLEVRYDREKNTVLLTGPAEFI